MYSSSFFPIEGAHGSARAPLISARLIHFHTALRRSHFTADGLPGSTLGPKWDPSHCGPLGVCVGKCAEQMLKKSLKKLKDTSSASGLFIFSLSSSSLSRSVFSCSVLVVPPYSGFSIPQRFTWCVCVCVFLCVSVGSMSALLSVVGRPTSIRPFNRTYGSRFTTLIFGLSVSCPGGCVFNRARVFLAPIWVPVTTVWVRSVVSQQGIKSVMVIGVMPLQGDFLPSLTHSEKNPIWTFPLEMCEATPALGIKNGCSKCSSWGKKIYISKR